ncbi:S8 family serine peptidase [Aeromicrobium sp. UC242_57]|uniref:S8 family serine peptidase n=1 Tax=Aeromicrobium sp. UC242_57 TaxID=3374624 RepID=UPI0037BFD757
MLRSASGPRRTLTVTLVSCLALSLTGFSASANEAPKPSLAPAKGGPAAPDPVDDTVPDLARGLIVKTTTSVPSDGLLAAADAALGSAAEVVADDKVSTKVSTVEFDEPIAGDEADEVAAAVAERSDVEWAVPDRLMGTQAAPPVNKNDPGFSSQRNLWSTVSSPVGGYSIKAPSLWRKTEGSTGTVVAVIDSGILPGHPDLAGKIVPGYDFVSGDGGVLPRDGGGRDNDPSDPGDWNAAGECGPGSRKSNSSWHGTFVAGQIAAATNNGQGIAAVAPNVKVQPIRALGSCGGWSSDIVAAMEYASSGPAKIVNMSLASPPLSKASRNQACQLFSYYAQRGNSRGAIFVAAAGNDGANANLATPASCPGFISVGATSAKGFSAIYSNIGSTVDLSAPGGDSTVEGKNDVIYSLSNAGTQGPSASYGYAAQQGTSMAAPQVAGAAALLYSLGFTTPGALTNAIYASVSPFRPKSSSYARKRVEGYVYDLNCTARGRKWCGRGLLDLSRVQAPLSKPVISGALTIGEPLRTSLGSWVRTPSPRYTWKVAGVVKGTSAVYWPTAADAGKSITVTITPSTAAFARLTNASVGTAAVPAGPNVGVTLPASSPRYGSAYTIKATVPGATSGQVQFRTDSGAVVATGQVAGGVASARVSGKALKPGKHSLRAAYLGNGTTPKASSPRKTVTIRKLTAKVTTKLPKKVSKSKRAALKVTVTERPNLFASPTGYLRVYDGKKRIVTTKLSGSGRGKKTIRLPELKKGTHKIRVLYRGNAYITSKYSIYRTIKVK